MIDWFSFVFKDSLWFGSNRICFKRFACFFSLYFILFVVTLLKSIVWSFWLYCWLEITFVFFVNVLASLNCSFSLFSLLFLIFSSFILLFLVLLFSGQKLNFLISQYNVSHKLHPTTILNTPAFSFVRKFSKDILFYFNFLLTWKVIILVLKSLKYCFQFNCLLSVFEILLHKKNKLSLSLIFSDIHRILLLSFFSLFIFKMLVRVEFSL